MGEMGNGATGRRGANLGQVCRRRLAVLILAVATAGPAAAQEPPGAVTELPAVAAPTAPVAADGADALLPPARRFPLEAFWNNGLWFVAPDDQFRVHVGGNAQVDSNWLIGPNGVFALPGGGANGVDNSAAVFLRRVRLRLEGDVYNRFDYIVEYDFAHAENENSGLQPPSFANIAGSPVPCNIWVQVRDVPFLGNVRFGSQVKPLGMTNNTYQGFLPFMERADNMDGFYGPFDSGFVLGLSARNWAESERLTWQSVIYRPSIDVFGVSLNKVAVGGRVTALPWYEDDGRRLIHLGLGSTGGEIVQDQLRVRARPLLRNGPGYAVPILVDTGEVPGSCQYTTAPEFAMVLGSWTFQAEWAGQFLTDAVAADGGPQGTVFYHGGYVELLYFLTGEHQSYEKKDGVFGRVVPRSDFRWKKGEACAGGGAWQLGARFSYLDLNDKSIQGGTVYSWTAGLNWFWNPNMKVQLNSIAEYRDQPGVAPGWINGVGMRAAFDF
jgi:phosphate-selective porin OprO/OprP